MKQFFTFLFLCFTISLFAQPVNDDCGGIIDLGVVPFCSTDSVFSNIGATNTNIGNGNVPEDCNPGGDWNFTGRDVWFQFTASDTIEDYTVTLTGVTDQGNNPITNPQIAIYRGDCEFDGMALLTCARVDTDGETQLQFDLIGLDLGETYIVRVNDWSPSAAPNSGDFVLCIDEQDPINTIDEMGSTACTGFLYDSGGPDNDYGSNENNVFTICPNAPFNECVTFTLSYYNFDDSFSEGITFYDGPNNSSPIISTLSGGNANGPNSGGVCYQVQASSGCLTVEFVSDSSIEFEGFEGMWECSASPCDTPTPISVESNIDNNVIIDALTTSQTVIEIDTIICPEGSYGTFLANDNSNLGLEKGLILTTGLATDAIGPNLNGGTGTDNNTFGDSDLDSLSIAGGNTNLSEDACVVELDVFVATDELRFDYIFGSEEYPEFVGGTFNDIFALLVSGSGITGDPNINNQQNVAILPGSNTPVQINSVNDSQNWEYYRDNTDGQTIGYDGLTSGFLGSQKSLTASIPVTPCNTYHLKFAIADRGDGQYDSGVFIGELRGGVPGLTFDSNFGIDFLVEDCSGTEDQVTVRLNNPQDTPQSYTVDIGGTAQRDIDYTLDMPDQITIPPGETELTFSIIPISDMIAEGDETVIIGLSNDFGCGVVELENIEITILDQPLVDINLGADTAFVCLADSSNQITLSATGATEYIWTPSNIFDDNNEPSVTATVEEDGYVYVRGQLGALSNCIAEDSIYLQRLDPMINIMGPDEYNICEGDTVFLNAVNNIDDMNFAWTPAGDLLNPNNTMTGVVPTFDTEIVASVEVTGCVVTDTVRINVDPFDFPNLIPDSTVCQGSPTVLADAPFFFTTTVFEWTPSETIEDNTIAEAIASPQDETTTYILSATSESGFCSQMDTVVITAIPAAIDISVDTAFTCLGDPVQIETSIVPDDNDIVWTPTNNMSNSTVPNPTVNPITSQYYFARIEVGDCVINDSIFIQVDSLPTIDTILLDPFKEVYCPGDTVILSSPLYDPMLYPNVENLWFPDRGFLTPDSFFNLVIETEGDTVIYTRTTTNNGCTSSISVPVPVFVPVIQITPDTVVCAGEPFQALATSADPEAEYTWSPANGLSCEECPDPTITVGGTTTFTIEAMVFGCPAMENYTAHIVQPPTLAVPPDQAICLNESITLNGVVQPDVTYDWTSSDPNFTSSAGNPTVTPTETTTYFITASREICPPISSEVTIEVIQPITFDVSEDLEVCYGEEFTLNATPEPTSSNDTYEWIGLGADGGVDGSLTVTPFSTGQRFYTINFTNGCEQLSEEIGVLVNGVSRVDSFSFQPFQMGLNDCFDEGERIAIAANLDTVYSGATYQWSQNGTTISSSGQSVETQILDDQPVTFSLEITTPAGCITNQSVGPFCVNPARAGVPNAFRPGGTEEINNFFNIQTVGLYEEVVAFKVWNRFGDLVYNNETPSTGWNGQADGKLAPSDVYLYYISVRKFTGEIEEFSGDVTLIR